MLLQTDNQIIVFFSYPTITHILLLDDIFQSPKKKNPITFPIIQSVPTKRTNFRDIDWLFNTLQAKDMITLSDSRQ